MGDGRANLEMKMEEMVKDLLNEYVVTDDDFKVSAPATMNVVKSIFGHTLTEQQLSKLNGYDGVVALFSVETGLSFDKPNVGVKLKSGSVERRSNMKERAQPTIVKLEPWLGKPVLEVWQGIDQFKNIYGDRSIYVCCFFGLKENKFPTFVTEKAN